MMLFLTLGAKVVIFDKIFKIQSYKMANFAESDVQPDKK